MRWWPPKKVISGCEARGDADSPYLIRWTLLRTPWGNLYLHKFLRSDADTLHDHPWDFWTLILWRGYTELYEEECLVTSPIGYGRVTRMVLPVCRRVRAGQILYRPATWIHRVELVGGKPAWTLLWVSGVKRTWGFWERGKWVDWQTYFKDKGC